MLPLDLHGTEALILSQTIGNLLKATLGRARPRVSGASRPNDFCAGAGFGSGDRHSFPSCHTYAASAAAAAVTSETTRWWPRSTWIVEPLMYGGAVARGAWVSRRAIRSGERTVVTAPRLTGPRDAIVRPSVSAASAVEAVTSTNVLRAAAPTQAPRAGREQRSGVSAWSPDCFRKSRRVDMDEVLRAKARREGPRAVWIRDGSVLVQDTCGAKAFGELVLRFSWFPAHALATTAAPDDNCGVSHGSGSSVVVPRPRAPGGAGRRA